MTAGPDPAPRAPEDPGARRGPDARQRARRRTSLVRIAAAGWAGAAAWGAASILIVVAAGQLLALTLAPSGIGGSPSASARIGWLLTCLFHRVPIRIEASAPVGTGGAGASGVVAAALLTGTAGAAAVLFIAGRSVADRVGGTAPERVLHGAKVAPVYALAAFVISTFVAVRIPVPANPFVGDLSIRPSPFGSLAWPFILAAVAGAAGGRSSAARAGDRRGSSGRVAAAGAGGWRMLILGLAFALAGLVVLAVAQPDAAAAYGRFLIRSGPGEAPAIVAGQALSLPNHAVLTLVPAMGGCDGVYSGDGVRLDAICLDRVPRELSLALFTPESGPSPEIGDAPRSFLLLLLAPAAASILGGVAAARRAEGSTGPQRAAVGASAGVVFAVLVAVASALAGIRVSGELFTGTPGGSVIYGPDPLAAGVLALGWGVVGGAIGSVLGGRHPRRPASTPG